MLCEAQRREHSRSYVTGVVTKHDCMDAGAGRSSCRERLNKESEIYDFICSYLQSLTGKAQPTDDHYDHSLPNSDVACVRVIGYAFNEISAIFSSRHMAATKSG